MIVTLKMKSTLRSERKRESMLRVQDVALTLFEERGYDAVSVEEVAVVAGVGAATVYRWFHTKQALVSHDDFDDALFARIGAALDDGAGVVDAVEAAVAAGLPRDAGALDRVRRRARLLLTAPSLASAGGPQREAFRAALSALFRDKRAADDALDADVKAAAVAAVVDVAIGHWIAAGPRASLPTTFEKAFARLRRLQG